MVVIAIAGEPTESVFSSLDRQDAWLSQSGHGSAWQSYLQTSQLREALAAPSVDRRFLASVLGRYSSHAPGLDAGPFASTRHSLTQLANQRNVPLALRWSEQARAAGQHQTPFSDSALREAKYAVIDAKSRLDQFLGKSSSATREGWRSFLNWNDLDEQLRSDAPEWKVLDGVVAKFFNGYPGLEYPEFVRTRDALRKYTYLGKLAGTEDGPKSLAQYHDALANALAKYNAKPSTKNAGDAATLVDWLEQVGRDHGLASQIRSAHSYPNIRLRVSEQFIGRRFSQSVHDTSPVNENILGTQVRGTAITNGHVTTNVVPNANAAQIDIIFNGVTTTSSVGRQKPVTIRSTSATNVSAWKPLYLYPTDINSAPAQANGSTRTTIHSITPDNRLGRKIVEKIAWKRAGEQKPKAERIAAERTSRRLEAKLDEQTQELIASGRARLMAQLRGPMSRRGLIPETIKTSSDEHHALVSAIQAGHGQLAAMSYPPTFDRGNGVVAQIHESAINNTAEKAIAGLTLTDERIAQIVEEMTGEIPEELQINDDDKPWSISFDWKQPVTVEFDDEMMKIAVRGRRFTSGESVLNKVMEMSANYLMQTVPGKGIVLTRQGDVDVTFPSTKEDARLRASDRVFKTLMQRKFSELFKPVIEGEGFVLPGKLQELGTIRLNSHSAENGWLSLGWQ